MGGWLEIGSMYYQDDYQALILDRSHSRQVYCQCICVMFTGEMPCVID